MNVLVIDNTILKDSWGSPEIVQLCQAVENVTVYVRRAPERDLPSPSEAAEKFDHIVLSGSITSALDKAPWIDELDDFIRELASCKKPMLGLCYGHQAIARALGGEISVRKANRPEFGWIEIEKTTDSPLFKGLPAKFYSFSSHYDEVCTLPGDFKRICKTPECENQGFQVKELPIFGVQFHPERTLRNAEHTYKLVRPSVKKIFKHPYDGEQYFNVSIGKKIFENFLKL